MDLSMPSSVINQYEDLKVYEHVSNIKKYRSRHNANVLLQRRSEDMPR